MANKSYWTYKRFLSRIRQSNANRVYDPTTGKRLEPSEYPDLHKKFKRSKKDIGEFLGQHRAPSPKVRKRRVKPKGKLTRQQRERIKSLRRNPRRNPAGPSLKGWGVTSVAKAKKIVKDAAKDAGYKVGAWKEDSKINYYYLATLDGKVGRKGTILSLSLMPDYWNIAVLTKKKGGHDVVDAGGVSWDASPRKMGQETKSVLKRVFLDGYRLDTNPAGLSKEQALFAGAALGLFLRYK